MNMNIEEVRIWRMTVIAYLKALSRHLPGENKSQAG
jgi:hypothetical protein